MPIVRAMVARVAEQYPQVAGSIKWVIAMKAIERSTGARRRHINAAIDRAVLELDDGNRQRPEAA